MLFEPAQEFDVAGRCRGKGRVAELASELVERGDRVGVGMGVDPAGDLVRDCLRI